MAKESRGAWCGPHNCHPSDCFLEHNPQLKDVPVRKVQYNKDLAQETFDKAKLGVWNHDHEKILTEDEIRAYENAVSRPSLSILGKRGGWRDKVTCYEKDGRIYAEFPYSVLESLPRLVSGFPLIELQILGFDSGRKIESSVDIEQRSVKYWQGLPFIVPALPDDAAIIRPGDFITIKHDPDLLTTDAYRGEPAYERTAAASEGSAAEDREREDPPRRRWIREIGHRIGVLRRKGSTS